MKKTKQIKAVLDNEVIVLNEVPVKSKIKASQISTLDGVKYFNPDKAEITPNIKAKPSVHHKRQGGKWVLDPAKKKKHDRSEKLAVKHTKALERLAWQEVKKDPELDAEDITEIDKKLNN
jgi:hypothetical protein